MQAKIVNDLAGMLQLGKVLLRFHKEAAPDQGGFLFQQNNSGAYML